MYRALALKELRETVGIAAVALLLYAYFTTGAIGFNLLAIYGGSSSAIPFVEGWFGTGFVGVSIGLAVALGFRQSVRESAHGTFQFLLHRPAHRNRLIGTKLAFGAGLFLVCAAAPVLLYAWWAATPGTHASPFYWSMTLATWKVWLSLTALYLGAFLSGIRPARWFGTRLGPLVASGVLVFAIQFLPWWWVFGLGAVLLLDALLLAAIFFVTGMRDF